MGKDPKKFGRQSSRPTATMTDGRPLQKLADGRTTPFTTADVTPPDGILSDLWAFDKYKSNTFVWEGTPSYNKDLDRSMERIYDMQNFHGQPTKYDNFEDMKNAAAEDGVLLNGQPMIIARTVPVVRWAEPLLGEGKHYAHSKPGFWGSGTYWLGEVMNGKYDEIGIVSEGYTPDQWNKVAKQSYEFYGEISKEYYGTFELLSTDIERPRTHQAYLKRSAKSNIAAITTSKGDLSRELFREWSEGLQKEFRETFGKDHPNLGVMASMLGYDAIHIPGVVGGFGGETMVFNRAATGVSTAEWKSN